MVEWQRLSLGCLRGASIMKLVASCVSLALLSFFPVLVGAQQARPACALLAAVDLKPLLGAGHAAPVPYGDVGCIVKSKTPGRLVMLGVVEKPNSQLKKEMAAEKKGLSSAEFAAISTLATAPQFGPEAFSAREKGDKSAAEIHAIKGTQAIALTFNGPNGAITDPVFRQLGELTGAVLARLPE
jgi:hypothetical protein